MRAAKVKGLAPARSLRSNLGLIVGVRLGELEVLAEKACEPDAVVAQHDMRIAAKRLRYVLEVSGKCIGPPAEKAMRAARDLQDVLGEIHDCDVMGPRVEATIERLRVEDAQAIRRQAGGAADLEPSLTAAAPNREAYPGLELLLVHLRARRELLFERFLELWRTEGDEGTWTRLERALP